MSGVETSVGSRHAAWVLDGSTSGDPDDALRSFTWSLSTSGSAACDSDGGWQEIAAGSVGEDPQVIRVATATTAAGYSADFRNALTAIADFDEATPSPDPTGAVRRPVRLRISDGAHASSVCTEIVVLNRAPEVSLGPDLRVAPGGKWWTIDTDVNGDGSVDEFDGDPTVVEIEARVSDLDEGDVEGTKDLPAVWYVSGELRSVLDLASPRDGRVDDTFFEKTSDPGHRHLRFAAPLMPQRGSLAVEIADVVDRQGNLLLSAQDEARVDVLSSHWVQDVASLRLSRLDTSRFQYVGQNMPLLAGGGRRALGVVPGGCGTNCLLAVHHTLVDQELASSPFATTVASSLAAASDGALGWWILDADDDTLWHLSPDLLSSDAYSSVEGNALSDFTLVTPAVAPADGGSVWVSGEKDGGGTARLYRIALDGSLEVAANAPSGASQLAADGNGGVWICGDVLRHVDASGATLDEDPTIAQCTSLSYDPDHDLLWVGLVVGLSGARDTFVCSGGVCDGLGLVQDGAIADPADGTAILPRFPALGQFTGFLRVDSTGDIVGSVSFPESQLDFGNYLVLEGGNILARATVGAAPTLAWFEGGVGTSSNTDLPVVAAEGDQPTAFAVDPATGFVWLWDAACNCVRAMADDGTTGTTPPLAAIDPVVSLAIDSEPDPISGARTLWLAWNDSTDGGLARLAIPSRLEASLPALVPVDLGGRSLDLVGELQIAPGDRLCISTALRGDTQPFTNGLVYRLSDGAVSEFVTPDNLLHFHMVVAADSGVPVAGTDYASGCWFVMRGVGALMSPADSWFVQDTGTTIHTLRVGGANPARTIYAADAWEGNQAFAPSATYGPGDWMAVLDPTMVDAGSQFVTVADPSDLTEVSGIWVDHFYKQVFVGLGTAEVVGAVPGRVLRLDRYMNERASYEGFVMPRVRGAR